jgi:hypothetical protein
LRICKIDFVDKGRTAMSDWREHARAIRTIEEECGMPDVIAAARDGAREALLGRQTVFARRMIPEVLAPVLGEFSGIVTREPCTPVIHEYDARTYGLTCDLDSVRFILHVFLLADGKVRVTVLLSPVRGDPHCRDFELSVGNKQIESWLGDCLVKLYEDRVPVHARNKKAKTHERSAS